VISVALIVPNHNTLDYSIRCIESFLRYTPRHIFSCTVLLVDDSDDGEFYLKTSEMTFDNRCKLHYSMLSANAGVTAAWNYGLQYLRNITQYTICTNCDILFTLDWWRALHTLLQYDTCELIGPITNAPGHCTYQDAASYGIDKISDDIEHLYAVSNRIYGATVPSQYYYVERINGFFMMAKTDTWWKYAYSSTEVFDPKYVMTGNEDEFQARAKEKGMKIAYTPNSYIFHYRSVTRPEALNRPEAKGAYRRKVTLS
jgi:GT2 family glycosyltransferase